MPASLSAAFAMPSLITSLSSPSSGSSSLFAASTSTGARSPKPLTLINSAAALGYTVLYILSECTGPGFVAIDIIPFSASSHEIISASRFFAPCDAVYGLLKR